MVKHNSEQHYSGSGVVNNSAPISEQQLRDIRDDLNNSNPRLAIDAQRDIKARKELAKYVRNTYKSYIHGDPAITEYIVKQLVGIGFLEDVLATDGITDIGWNGSFLTIETNSDKISLSKEDLGGEDTIDESYITRIVNRFLSSQDKELNSKNAIIDLLMDNLRLSIVDRSLTPTGTTFSIRVTRPSLALNQNNFAIFAPSFVLDMIHTIMLTGAVSTISGITGTGKTELQKLMISFTNPKERIIVVEDVAETHLKELFPDKDIFSYLTTAEHPITELVRTSLRQNPDWVHIAETRGAEAFEMLQGVLTGNYMVTTLHTVDTFAVPKRFSNMITNEYANASEASIIEDVLTYFDFGFHIEKLDIYDAETGDTKKIRYLSEIREFKNDPDRGTLIFKQDFENGQFLVTTNDFSDEFKSRMAKKFMNFSIPTFTREPRTDISGTPEGQLLNRIRAKMKADGLLDDSGTVSSPIFGVRRDVTSKLDVEEEDNSDLYVKPNSHENYSNPANIVPEEPSLYKVPQDVLSRKHKENEKQVAEQVKHHRVHPVEVEEEVTSSETEMTDPRPESEKHSHEVEPDVQEDRTKKKSGKRSLKDRILR